MVEYYFIYCTKHDDGVIVESNNNNNRCNSNSNSNIDCTFIYNGIVKVDRKNIVEINKVRRNYDVYGGGFRFEYYKNCCNNELLKNWIEKWIENN